MSLIALIRGLSSHFFLICLSVYLLFIYWLIGNQHHVFESYSMTEKVCQMKFSYKESWRKKHKWKLKVSWSAKSCYTAVAIGLRAQHGLWQAPMCIWPWVDTKIVRFQNQNQHLFLVLYNIPTSNFVIFTLPIWWENIYTILTWGFLPIQYILIIPQT